MDLRATTAEHHLRMVRLHIAPVLGERQGHPRPEAKQGGTFVAKSMKANQDDPPPVMPSNDSRWLRGISADMNAPGPTDDEEGQVAS